MHPDAKYLVIGASCYDPEDAIVLPEIAVIDLTKSPGYLDQCRTRAQALPNGSLPAMEVIFKDPHIRWLGYHQAMEELDWYADIGNGKPVLLRDLPLSLKDEPEGMQPLDGGRSSIHVFLDDEQVVNWTSCLEEEGVSMFTFDVSLDQIRELQPVDEEECPEDDIGPER